MTTMTRSMTRSKPATDSIPEEISAETAIAAKTTDETAAKKETVTTTGKTGDNTETTDKTTAKAATTKVRDRAEKIAKAAKGPSRVRSALGWLKPPKSERKGSWVIWAGAIRSLTLMGYYLMLMITVFGVIPFLGAWIHQQGGAGRVDATPNALIALWIMPLAFLVILLAVGELVLIRNMWRSGSRLIARIKARGQDDEGVADEQGSQASAKARVTTTTSTSGTTSGGNRNRNRNKKKR